jgi:ketosteroid isomerase-like protein
MTNEAMDSLARRSFDAVCAADAERLRDLFTHDLRWRVPKGAIEPFGGSHDGADRIIELMLGAVGGSFVDGSQKFRILTTLFGADIACVETEMTASTPDGREYRNGYTFFFEFREGRISEIREHVDTRYAAEFFG